MTNKERFKKWLDNLIWEPTVMEATMGRAAWNAALPDDVRQTLIEMAGEAIDAAQEDAHRHVMRPARQKAAYARMERYAAARKWLEGE